MPLIICKDCHKEISDLQSNCQHCGAKIKQLPQKVVIVDIRIPFSEIVAFMVKCSIAAIPAMLIIWFMYVLLAGFFVGLIGHK